MRLKFKLEYLVGILLAVGVVIVDVVYFRGTRWFVALLVLALNVGWAQFWFDYYREIQRQKEIELKFLEFIRALVSSVRSGLPISKGVLHVADEDFGAFSPYVKKLSNQIEWGIPLHRALVTMANDTRNPMIKRSISIVIEADKSGGDIENVLQSVSQSVYTVKSLKQKRKSETHSQVVQGYVVFFIFIGVMLMIQIWLNPQLSGLQGEKVNEEDVGAIAGVFGNSGQADLVDIDRIFFFLVIIQGFFSGLTIGKFSEGSLKQGILHSLVLILIATLIITLVKGGI